MTIIHPDVFLDALKTAMMEYGKHWTPDRPASSKLTRNEKRKIKENCGMPTLHICTTPEKREEWTGYMHVFHMCAEDKTDPFTFLEALINHVANDAEGK